MKIFIAIMVACLAAFLFHHAYGIEGVTGRWAGAKILSYLIKESMGSEPELSPQITLINQPIKSNQWGQID